MRLRFISPRYRRARPVVMEPAGAFPGLPHGWWRAYPRVGRARQSPLDICDPCGHVRALHGGDCFASSTKLIGEPDPCRCTNHNASDQYRRPGAK